MIIEVKKGKYLKIVNTIQEYEKLIEYRLMSFKKIETSSKKIDNILQITPKNTKVKVLGEEYILKRKLIKTDIYTLINATISIMLSNKNNAFVHSSIVSKKNKGILLLSTFGQGKTTLALEMEKLGFDINSADYTHLCLTKGELFMKRGSRYMKCQEGARFINQDKATANVKIRKVVLLYGLCDGGKYKEIKIKDRNHEIKALFPFLTWWTNSPLITDPRIIFKNLKYEDMFRFLTKLLVITNGAYILRGDKKRVALKLNKEIETSK